MTLSLCVHNDLPEQLTKPLLAMVASSQAVAPPRPPITPPPQPSCSLCIAETPWLVALVSAPGEVGIGIAAIIMGTSCGWEIDLYGKGGLNYHHHDRHASL